MASIQKITTETGQPRYRVRYRDPARKSKEKRFRRKVDADRFAREVEVYKDRGTWTDPAGGVSRSPNTSRNGTMGVTTSDQARRPETMQLSATRYLAISAPGEYVTSPPVEPVT